MTTLPALSTPCTWNTFLARSTPMVLTCMWTTPSGDSLFNDHPFGTFDAGSGRRPLHQSRRFGPVSVSPVYLRSSPVRFESLFSLCVPQCPGVFALIAFELVGHP